MEIENLEIAFDGNGRRSAVVDGVSLQIEAGQLLGLVGESGCGKSLTALSILGLQPSTATITRGKVLFDDNDLLRLSDDQLRSIRGNDIAMIFQEPMSALNPVLTIGSQVAEVLHEHRNLNRSDLNREVIELLRMVEIPDPESRAGNYPHQFSGGMLQRAMIAMAIACRPRLLIADEPTTALDVTVQAQILDLLDKLRLRYEMGMLLVTHDLGIVAERADDVAIMYSGRIVERAPARELFSQPQHPYTKGLLASIPRPGLDRLESISGTVPEAHDRPIGCRFRGRCGEEVVSCSDDEPGLRAVAPDHLVACVHHGSSSGN